MLVCGRELHADERRVERVVAKRLGLQVQREHQPLRAVLLRGRLLHHVDLRDGVVEDEHQRGAGVLQLDDLLRVVALALLHGDVDDHLAAAPRDLLLERVAAGLDVRAVAPQQTDLADPAREPLGREPGHHQRGVLLGDRGRVAVAQPLRPGLGREAVDVQLAVLLGPLAHGRHDVGADRAEDEERVALLARLRRGHAARRLVTVVLERDLDLAPVDAAPGVAAPARTRGGPRSWC